MINTNQITFNLSNFPYELKQNSVKRLALRVVKDCSKVLRIDSVKSLKSAIVKHLLRAVAVKVLRLLRGVRGLGRGACVRKFQALTRMLYIIKGKLGAYRVAVGSSLCVPCQFGVTPAALPLYWACTPNTLLDGLLDPASLPHYTLSPTDPHPLNFGADCYIHPTVIPPHFLRMKKGCPSE